MRFANLLRLTLCAAALLGAAPAAEAATVLSGNWSGYAVQRPGVRFRKVSASWVQPGGSCATGRTAYSAFWVGLGGFNLNSQALEQIGTELDCTPFGGTRLSAWYELVPAPSRRIALAVAAGDVITASVGAAGRRVTLTLRDLTRHESFSRTIVDHRIDLSSAEWIAEAPSECFGQSQCRTLPLADFGSVGFWRASAQTRTGRPGPIASRRWRWTRILLGAGGPTFASTGHPVVQAAPSPLVRGGQAFEITYTGGPPPSAVQQQGVRRALPATRAGSASAGASIGGHQRVVQRIGTGTG